MREIKFRAWDKELKKMVYKGFWDRNWYGTPHNDEGGCHTMYELNEIKSYCELMQFTGLKDKNGKEIYEGDIMQGSVTSPKYRVTMDCGRWCANYTHKGNSGALQLYFRQDMFEIIGNIYENGGLLK